MTHKTSKTHKTQGNRTKEYQDFYTPNKIALKLFEEYKKYLKTKPYINKVLEPTVGAGNLIWVLLESEYNVKITCLDIQEDLISELNLEAKRRGYWSHLAQDSGLLIISNCKNEV